MKCPLRGNIECNKLKYQRDELFCNSSNKFLQDMSHNECNGDDEFTNIRICPRCGRKCDSLAISCETCGWDFRNHNDL